MESGAGRIREFFPTRTRRYRLCVTLSNLTLDVQLEPVISLPELSLGDSSEEIDQSSARNRLHRGCYQGRCDYRENRVHNQDLMLSFG